jgi:hypothetical protein
VADPHLRSLEPCDAQWHCLGRDTVYQMLRGRSLKALSIDALPPLAAAFLLAEIFYKWHSFTLECLGFLATWFVLDMAWTKLVERLRPPEPLDARPR